MKRRSLIPGHIWLCEGWPLYVILSLITNTHVLTHEDGCGGGGDVGGDGGGELNSHEYVVPHRFVLRAVYAHNWMVLPVEGQPGSVELPPCEH